MTDERILEIRIRPGNTKSWVLPLTKSVIQNGPLSFFNFNLLLQSNEYIYSLEKIHRTPLRLMDMEKPHKVGKKIHQLLNLIHTEGSSDNDYV